MRLLVVASLVTWTGLAARPAHAETLTDTPCEGCLVIDEGPRGEDLPLFVVLHGDEGQPGKLRGVWAPIAKELGVRVLLPRCPRDEGCTTGSFWRWGADASWLLGVIDRVTARFPTDERRVYVGGWSGGATWLTQHAESVSARAAALSIAGGGAPLVEPCAERGCVFVHQLTGTRNPLFDLASQARASIEACGHQVRVDVLERADHAAEWRAYVERAPTIARELLEHTRASCEPPPAPAAPSASASASARPSEGAPSPTPSTSPAASVSAPRGPSAPLTPASRGCACAVASGSSEAPGGLAAALLPVLVAVLRFGAWLKTGVSGTSWRSKRAS